jgi:hypothetical protein
MEKRQQKNTVVLKYDKRRYDGGSEIEVIRSIERKNRNEQLAQSYHASGLTPTEMSPGRHALETSGDLPVDASQPNLVRHDAASSRIVTTSVMETILMGPLEVTVGIVGMLTAGLAVATFRQAGNTEMVAQSQQVMRDCYKTFLKGLWDCLTTPVRVFRAKRQKR